MVYRFIEDVLEKSPGDWEEEEEPNSPVLVNSRGVTAQSRAACAMHHSLDADEPLWIMIPIESDIADVLKSIILVTKNGERFSLDVSE